MSPGLLSVFGRRAINIPPSGVLVLTYLLLIAVGTGFGTVAAVMAASRRLFDERERLRLDRIGGSPG